MDNNRNTGDGNAGYRNTGDFNTGDSNTGYRNTGDSNTGYSNTGDSNTGDRNTGDGNTGYRNTGDFNTGDFNTGYFNIDEPKVRIFGKETDVKREDIYFPSWLYFNLIEWINEGDMTEEQKEDPDNEYYKTTGGILVKYNYKEAFQKSYNKATREEQLKVKELPNWNSDMFFEISGIRVDDEPKVEISMDEIAEKFNIDVSSLKIKK